MLPFLRTLPAARLGLAIFALSAGLAPSALSATNNFVAPGVLAHGQKLGAVDPSTSLRLTVWLKMHDQGDLDSRVEALYTPGSSTFHQWLKQADLQRYLPTSAETESVRNELAARGLKVLSVDPAGLFVRVAGSAGQVESAFGTTLAKYQVRNGVTYVSASEPKLSGAAGALVASIGGLNAGLPDSLGKHAVNPVTGKALNGGKPLAKGTTASTAQDAGTPQPEGEFFSSYCFWPPVTTNLSGIAVTFDFKPMTETVNGLRYGLGPVVDQYGNSTPPCGYSVPQVQSFYGLGTAYGRGYTGAGQTIAIIEKGTHATAESNANAFNSLQGLPALTAANYAELNPFGVVEPGYMIGTDEQTDLEVQWAHAIAPGAKIALVDTFGGYEDLQAGEMYVIENGLANQIVLSYDAPEPETGEYVEEVFGEVAELAAAKGISLQVGTGDEGDGSGYTGGTPTVSALAASPWDTAVGGTAIARDPFTDQVYTTGYGMNFSQLTQGPGFLADPPNVSSGFSGGSGGGVSAYFAKPAYQAKLAGTGRMLPDVSALASQYTGVEYVYNDPFSGDTFVGTFGGSNLATTIFSGMWAILNQYAGSPLGNAAPYVAAAAGTPFIKDVLPAEGPANVTVTATDSRGTAFYDADQMATPLLEPVPYLSAQWEADNYGNYAVLTFGPDLSLTMAPGWDPVTGWGTPDFAAIFTALP